MNTVFKAGYQAYPAARPGGRLRAAVGGRAGCRGASGTPWAAVAAVLLLLGLVYPYARQLRAHRRVRQRRRRSTASSGWRRRSPGDPGAIAWIRDHTPGDAVVLEAFGDDYSAFGHARISTFTGRSTVMGWAGHELQWQHNAGTRINDIKTLYTTHRSRPWHGGCSRATASATSSSGRSSRRPTATPALAKWDQLGEGAFSAQGTTVCAIS